MASKLLTVAEVVLGREKIPLSATSIVDKAVRRQFLQASTSLVKRMSNSLRRATSHSHRRTRPRFLRLGKTYGLGSWFDEWPPSIAELSYYILLADKYMPLHVSELTKKMKKVRTIGGANPESKVDAILSYYKRFVSFGDGKYGLYGWKKHLARPIEFWYSTPRKDWVVSQQFFEVLSSANERVRISTPYIDKSSFETFMANIPTPVEVKLLVQTNDRQMPAKIDQGLTSTFLSRWLAGRTMFVRVIDDLHSRFIVVDDLIAGISSADLQRSQQQQKYQYLAVTRDRKLVRQCIEYFDGMWAAAGETNLVGMIQGVEESRRQTH